MSDVWTKQINNILFDIDGLIQILFSEFLNESVCVANNKGENLDKTRVHYCSGEAWKF